MRADDTAFAVVFPHSDDLSIFAGGLVRTWADQGRTGWFIKVTNDEKDSEGLSIGETIRRIEIETAEAVEILGLQGVVALNYQNHALDHGQLGELRQRLITLFRHLRVDTVVSFHPTMHGEENPDHYLTGMAVDAACWMAGRRSNLPEHALLGLEPITVAQRYYVTRGAALDHDSIDVTAVLAAKRAALLAHRTPMERMWRESHVRHARLEEYVESTFLGLDQDGHHIERFHRVLPARSEKGHA